MKYEKNIFLIAGLLSWNFLYSMNSQINLDENYLIRAALAEDSLSKKVIEAASQNNFEEVLKLLDFGVLVDSRTSCGLTPLHFAAYYGHKEAVRQLLRYGADCTIYPSSEVSGEARLTPFCIAKLRGNKECEALLFEPGISLSTDSLEYPLGNLAALIGDSDELVKHLPKKVSSTNAGDLTLLHLASTNSSDKCVKLLLAHDAPLKKERIKGRLPVHYAARYGSKEVFIALCDYESQAREKDDAGANVLHLAAANKNRSLLEYLLIPDLPLFEKDNEGREPFHYAAQYGPLLNVYLFIKYGKTRNVGRTDTGSTVLHCAALNKDYRCTELLLKLFYKPDQKNYEGLLPIHIAARFGTVLTVSLLWDAGPHGGTAAGETLLHLSARNEDSQVLNFLLLKQCDCEVEDANGIRPLHRAARDGTLEHVKKLVEHDASLKAVSHDGSTVLHYAAGNPDRRVIAYFLKRGLDKSALTEKGATALHAAAQWGTVEGCQLLINEGLSVHDLDKNGDGMLYYACRNPSREVFAFFIGKKVRPRNSNQLIREIARRGAPRMLQNLIDAGIISRDYSFISEGRYACENPNASFLKAFITSGFDVTMRGPDNIFPIQRVARFGTPQLLKLLEAKGVSLSVVTDDEETLLHLAAINESAAVLEALLAKEAPGSLRGSERLEKRTLLGHTPLRYAALKGSAKHCRMLIRKGADLGAQESSGRTLLHEAACNKDASVLELFLDETSLGAAVDQPNLLGRTPLFYAALNGSVQHLQIILNHLILRGKNSPLTSCSDKNGFTLLHAAARNSDSGPLEFLLKRGIDPNVICTNGEKKVPLHGAAECGHLKNCKLLVSHGALVTAKTAEGKTPSQLVLLREFPDCYLFLLARELEYETASDSVKAPGENNTESWFRHAHEFLKMAVSLAAAGHDSLEKQGILLFNAHQCAEAALKAYLIENRIMRDKIHRLDELLESCTAFDRNISRYLRDAVIKLEPYYSARYPHKKYALETLTAIELAYTVLTYVKKNR